MISLMPVIALLTHPRRRRMPLCAAIACAALVIPVEAAPPQTAANPFNAQAITNSVVSPTNPPTRVQVKRARRVVLLQSVQKLNQQNVQQAETQLKEVQDQYDQLLKKLEDLEEDDKDREDLEKEIDDLEEKLDFFTAVRDIYSRNFQFVATQIKQVQGGAL